VTHRDRALVYEDLTEGKIDEVLAYIQSLSDDEKLNLTYSKLMARFEIKYLSRFAAIMRVYYEEHPSCVLSKDDDADKD
jgi:hypothetical protein